MLQAYLNFNLEHLLLISRKETLKMLNTEFAETCFEWTVPQLSIMIIYICTWSILIQ